MNNKLVWIAAGSIILAAVSFFQLSRSRRKKKKTPPPTDREVLDPPFMEDRILYMHEITDAEQFTLLSQHPNYHKTIHQITYQLLLNLNKGTIYEGVVKISLTSQKKKMNMDDLYIDYVGKSILYLSVNGKRIDEEEVSFRKHQILVRKEWLHPHENHIEIIFANKYAFMGDGLTAYFLLDENNKYSLKGQTIYSKNGTYQCPHIFPCCNILNNCTLKLQILQPEGFQAFSNTPKSLVRLCSKQDYPQYPFFFQVEQKRLNRSFRMNSSSFASSRFDGSSHRSGEDLVKSSTEFYQANLMSIHGFFVLCASIYEVRPTIHKNYSNDILIRYFTKEHCLKKAQSYISLLHYQLMEINTRLENYSKKHEVDLNISHKIDIFFLDDLTAEGNFYTGSIYLNEDTLSKNFVDMRIFYLLSRAVVGMGLLDIKQYGVLTLNGKIKLNQLILDIFPQCTDYIYVKQFSFKKLKEEVLGQKFKNQTEEEQFRRWFQEYYEKECRLLVNQIKIDKVTSVIASLMKSFAEGDKEQFWAHFVSSYQMIEPTVTEVILKIGTRDKGIPEDAEVLDYIKTNCTKSRYYLKFFKNEQIQNDLKRFIELDSYGLEKRIPFIKIKQKYKKFLNEKIENYLSIKSNRLEARNLYEQFKRYNEARNFHHLMILKKQIKRVRLLAAEHLQEERRALECGLFGWKMLRKLKISPKDDALYQLIQQLEYSKESE